MKERTIIHVDMDAFFAAVEVRDNPELKGKPLIIGALPTERGVVSTCSYEARKYGVHSAMNIKEAYRRCPNGIYMHGNMYKYAEASDRIHKIMLSYTDKIEFVALDEGYMDVTASLKLFGGAENIGRELKKRIFDEVKVTCSVGISYCMMGAKMASEEKKPDGFFVIPDKAALIKLIEERPVGIICGIGKKTEEHLNRIGIYTAGDLRRTDKETLRSFGVMGEEMLRKANGIDEREVVPDAERKSIGREHTFQTDISDIETMKDALLLLSRAVSLRAKRSGVWGRTVTLKLKLADMRGITRSKSGGAVNSVRDIYRIAEEMLLQIKPLGKVRLVGVSISNLQDSKTEEKEQMSLFDIIEPEENIREKKTEALEDAVFKLQSLYGSGALKTAKELEVWNRIDNEKEKGN